MNNQIRVPREHLIAFVELILKYGMPSQEDIDEAMKRKAK